jgi:hypothetical protein
MAQEALAGIANLYIDGSPVKLVSGLTYQTSVRAREPANGMDGFHGYTVKISNGSMKFTVRLTSDQPLSFYDDLTDSTVVAELINGSTVSGYNMFVTEPPEGDAAEATATISFAGPLVSVDG